MPEWRSSLNAADLTLHMRYPVISNSHRPGLTYVVPEIRWSIISNAPTLHTLWPTHGSLSFPSTLSYIRYGRGTVSAVPNTPTLPMLCPIHGGLSFPSRLPLHTLSPRNGGLSIHRPYLTYVSRGKAISHSHRLHLTYAVPETRWSLIPNAPTLHLFCLRYSDHSFPQPLPYMLCGRHDGLLFPLPQRHLGYESLPFYLLFVFSPLKHLTGVHIAQIWQNYTELTTLSYIIVTVPIKLTAKKIFAQAYWDFPETIW